LEIKTDYNIKFKEFLDQYSENQKPIQVNFREIVNHLKFLDRATHSIHPYPARLLPNIPYFFLNNNYFVSENDSVLDPFSGSGTVLLESILSGMNAYGTDANPLARLIAKVKTNNYNLSILEKTCNLLQAEFEQNITIEDNFPNVINLDYWFLPNIKIQLNTILKSLNKIESKKYKNFFLLCFSNCINKVSLADSRVSVPVRMKVEHYPKNHPFRIKNENKIESLKKMDVYKKFIEITNANIRKIENKKRLSPTKLTGKITSNDARKTKIKSDSIDLIITSPPYAGAQKYIRASSLNLGWTELTKDQDLKSLDNQNIGRENYVKSQYIELRKTGIEDADILLEKVYLKNPLRAHIAANYLLEMEQAIKESIRVLKPNKHFIIVAANNQVCGFEFKTQDYLRQIAEKNGMNTICKLIDNIKSYGLMTKRNKTASIITCEWVLILKKWKRN
jgi:tRNA G10  N-methylase Trm11